MCQHQCSTMEKLNTKQTWQKAGKDGVVMTLPNAVLEHQQQTIDLQQMQVGTRYSQTNMFQCYNNNNNTLIYIAPACRMTSEACQNIC